MPSSIIGGGIFYLFTKKNMRLAIFNNIIDYTGIVKKTFNHQKYAFDIKNWVLQNEEDVKNAIRLVPVGSDLRVFPVGYIRNKKWNIEFSNDVANDNVEKEVTEQVEAMVEENKEADKETETVDEVEVDEDVDEEVETLLDKESILEKYRKEYKEVLGKDVPNNKKNNLDWITKKIEIINN